MHPHHYRIALHMLGHDPLETPSLEQQLADAATAVGKSLQFYQTSRSTVERGYCLASIGMALQPHAEAYAGSNDYAFGHALGRAARHLILPPPGDMIPDVVLGDSLDPLGALRLLDTYILSASVPVDPTVYRLRVPVVYGRGSDSVVVPVGHAVKILDPCVVYPDGNRYALYSWGGMLGILAEPERRLEPKDPLGHVADRWQLLKDIFEGEDPGVWGEDVDILARLQETVATAGIRDVTTARTRYRRGELTPERLPWVVARIEALKAWRKTSGTFEERLTALPADIRNACARPRLGG